MFGSTTGGSGIADSTVSLPVALRATDFRGLAVFLAAGLALASFELAGLVCAGLVSASLAGAGLASAGFASPAFGRSLPDDFLSAMTAPQPKPHPTIKLGASFCNFWISLN
jgi:hypothetical protein